MLNTTTEATRDKLRGVLEEFASNDRVPALSRALQALFAARDYKDPALIQSAINTVFEAFCDLTHEIIQERLGMPQQIRERYPEFLELLRNAPAESYDDFGKEVESRFDKVLENLIDIRDKLARRLQEQGYEVKNVKQLEDDITELLRLKKSTIENWPWSGRTLPPVNRKMVAESRAAIAQCDVEPIEDLIRRLRG